jgi:hypothetical protein
VDAATGGFQDKETAMRISQDMEDSIENGELCFRNCYDWRPIYETGVPRKVLGLRWDTEMDKISVDERSTIAKKRKRAYTEDSADLSYPVANLPN